jgi:hypothetical protein
MTSETSPALPTVQMNGQSYTMDAKGRLTPVELIRDQDKLQDDLVRRLYAAALEQEKALRAFKLSSLTDVDAFNAILADKYGARAGGVKGNITLATFDGLISLQVQVADQISFGPELQVAKTLVDECLEEWSADSRSEIRKLIMDAFDVDKEGNINRGKLFSLLRLDITDARWVRAMGAIRDSIRIDGTSRYIRFYRKPSVAASKVGLSLNIATV